MRGFRIGAIVLLVPPLVGPWFGCANNDDAVSAVSDRVSQNGSGDHQPSASSAAHGQSSNLSDVLAAWDSDNKEMAVDQLLLKMSETAPSWPPLDASNICSSVDR